MSGKEDWLYPDASGLYFQHDGFVMRASDGKQYDIEEECELLNKMSKENEQLKSDFLNRKLFVPYKKEIERLKLQNKELLTANATIRRENEQLKSRINDYDVALKTLQDLADKKLKENEQLKQQNKQLKHWNKCLAEKRHKELEE